MFQSPPWCPPPAVNNSPRAAGRSQLAGNLSLSPAEGFYAGVCLRVWVHREALKWCSTPFGIRGSEIQHTFSGSCYFLFYNSMYFGNFWSPASCTTLVTSRSWLRILQCPTSLGCCCHGDEARHKSERGRIEPVSQWLNSPKIENPRTFKPDFILTAGCKISFL